MTGILSTYELDFLMDKVQLKGKDAVNARYRIKKKIESLRQLIPLLESQGYLIDNQLETSSLMETNLHLYKSRVRSEAGNG